MHGIHESETKREKKERKGGGKRQNMMAHKKDIKDVIRVQKKKEKERNEKP